MGEGISRVFYSFSFFLLCVLSSSTGGRMNPRKKRIPCGLKTESGAGIRHKQGQLVISEEPVPFLFPHAFNQESESVEIRVMF